MKAGIAEVDILRIDIDDVNVLTGWNFNQFARIAAMSSREIEALAKITFLDKWPKHRIPSQIHVLFGL